MAQVIMKDTPVIILCGGEGTRIADVSGDAVPKPLIHIGDRPILWHIMKIYSSFGYNNFILTLGHLGWAIKNYFLNSHLIDCDFEMVMTDGEPQINVVGNTPRENWTIKFVETGQKTQTGQRVAMCERYVETDHFMVTYGDGVADIDINALTNFAARQGKVGTVTSVTPSSRFGQIDIDPHGKVRSFAEKEDAGGGNINGGFFVFRREFMEIVKRHGDVMLEREPMTELVACGELAAFQHDGFWEPMDTMREYRQLNKLWADGQAKWKRW